MYAPKMLPGQEPYTPEELARLESFVSAAIEAAEVYSEDELEWHAIQERKPLAKIIL
jgi:hypothetical protein